jgi:Ca2+-binding RTX toxin-like protein
MATYDLTQTQLENNLAANFDNATIDAIVNYLQNNGAFTGSGGNELVKVRAEQFAADPPVAGVEIESITAENSDVPGTGDLDALIFNDPDDSQIRVNGPDDMLIATAGGDNTIVLFGTGDYVVYAGDGNDIVNGEPAGTLRAFGQGGDDRLQVGAGVSTLDGGTGDDTLWDDNAANDKLFGGDDNDRIDLVGSGDNTVRGGIGDDTIYASGSSITGNNVLDGQEGDDVIFGGPGSSTLTGGDGDNLLVSGSAAGEGSLLRVIGTGSSTLYAGAGDDTLTGSGASGDNIFKSGLGAATMSGGSGDDTFGVTASDDSTDNNGDLTIVGGSGTDNVFFELLDFADATSIDTSGGPGTAVITFAGEGLVVTVSGVENLFFQNGTVVPL